MRSLTEKPKTNWPGCRKIKTMKEIIKSFQEAGICREWLRIMKKHPTVGAFCELFFRGSDFALEHNLPRREHLQKYREEAAQGGLYIDQNGTFVGTAQRAFFGKSTPEIIASGHDVLEIYLRDQTTAKLRIEGSAYVVVNLLDEAAATVEMADTATCAVYRYGRGAKVVGTVSSVTEKEF